MSEREGQKPLPRCKMILLCEGIATDETTRRWTIHGLITDLRFHDLRPQLDHSWGLFGWSMASGATKRSSRSKTVPRPRSF
jgi:hypothetical protein